MNIIRPTYVTKPWGYEEILFETEHYVSKILHIDEGKRLSLQYHEHKIETLYVMSGEVMFEFFETKDILFTEFIVKPHESIHIQNEVIHRITANVDSKIFETSTPHLYDIVRLEDDYGRV